MRAVNLIPAEERSGASVGAGRSGGVVYAVLGLLGGLAVLALLYGRADHQISSRRAEVATLTARTQQVQARAGALAPYASFVQMREQREQAVSALVNSRFDWSQTFRELGHVLPPGKVSLTSVDGTVGSSSGSAATPAAAAKAPAPAATGATSGTGASTSAAVTSATPPGSVPTFTLTGCAVSQAEVAVMLERLRLIVGVSEVTLQSSTQSSATGAGGGGGGGASGGCASGNPAFSAQVVFDALPVASHSLGTPGSATSVAASATSTGASR